MLVFMFLLDFSSFAFLMLTAALIHEFGHLAAMFICGVKVERITVYPFGLDIRTSSQIKSYKQDLFIKSAGIFVNISAALLCLAVKENLYISFFMMSNIMFAVLNILPINSLDGGEILESLLLMYMNPNTVMKIMKPVSFVFIVILWIVAVYVLFYTNYNFSLLILCMYLFTSIFLNHI
jgi:Zn-dependent proteases